MCSCYNDSMEKNSDKKSFVEWDAKEFIEYKRGAIWYVVLAIVVLALAAFAVWQQQWSFLVLIVVATVALLVYVMRPPRTLHYSLDEEGIKEGKMTLRYEDYRSFGVLSENNHYSIVLIPKKRFSPRVMIYFPEESGERIVDVFGERLPMEPVKLDLVDQLVRLLRI